MSILLHLPLPTSLLQVEVLRVQEPSSTALPPRHPAKRARDNDVIAAYPPARGTDDLMKPTAGRDVGSGIGLERGRRSASPPMAAAAAVDELAAVPVGRRKVSAPPRSSAGSDSLQIATANAAAAAPTVGAVKFVDAVVQVHTFEAPCDSLAGAPAGASGGPAAAPQVCCVDLTGDDDEEEGGEGGLQLQVQMQAMPSSEAGGVQRALPTRRRTSSDRSRSRHVSGNGSSQQSQQAGIMSYFAKRFMDLDQ